MSDNQKSLVKNLKQISKNTDLSNYSARLELFFYICASTLIQEYNNFKDLSPCSKKSFTLFNRFFRTELFPAKSLSLALQDNPPQIAPLIAFLKTSPTINYKDLIENLAFVYEYLLVAYEANRTGSFYTPIKTVDFMLSRLAMNDNLSEQFLDPACGTGVFLRRLLQKQNNNKEFLENCIFGADLNPLSVAFCKLLLSLQCCSEKSAGNLLRKEIPDLSKNFFTGDSLLAQKLFPEKFNYILCNPPFGISRNQQISSAQKTLYRERYSELFPGKQNKYLLFTQLCLQNLKPDGQALIITPNAWLGIKSAHKFRKYLSQSGELKAIYNFQSQIFPRLGVECVIAHFIKNNKVNDDIQVNFYDQNNQLLKNALYASKNFQSSKQNQIPLFWQESFNELMEHLEDLCIPLNQEFSQKIALQVYRKNAGQPPQTEKIIKEHLYHTRTQKDSNHFPYIDGRDIKNNQINWSGKYLNYGKWCAEYQDPTLYQRPRILVREVLGSKPDFFQTTYTNEIFFYNRSILHIHEPEDCRKKLKLLNRILNSEIGNLIILLYGKKIQRRLFPKIVAEDLKSFLIPSNFSELANQCSQNESASDLNELIYEYYSFNKAQRRQSRKILQDYCKW